LYLFINRKVKARMCEERVQEVSPYVKKQKER